ncbi:MAG: RluA family pseudouridine synthase [Myxococcota bacterium]|nr:RluA family pseudouridine synthase [Myxococcota bacterium]
MEQPAQRVSRFDPQPAVTALPRRLPHPFSTEPPHPLARRAAESLQQDLRTDAIPGVDLRSLDRPGLGKMFGVLVVADREGQVGYLRAFSGMLDGRWEVEGFVPPLFDQQAKDSFWPALEAELDALQLKHAELTGGAEVLRLQAQAAQLLAQQADDLLRLKAAQEQGRSRRREERLSFPEDLARQARLAQESRAESEILRSLVAAQGRDLAILAAPLWALEEERARLEKTRADRSREHWLRLTDTYRLTNPRGETTTVTALFAPQPPPGGAGDCAGPKLLGYAYRHGLRPLAFAEFWWGASSSDGDRVAGEFYPACQTKCGRVLPFMLQGWEVEPHPERDAPPPLRILFEDDWLLVLEKPAGLPSTPGRRARDSLLTRLQRHCPSAALVSPLAPEQSGVVLAAKDRPTLTTLQRQLGKGEATVDHEGTRARVVAFRHPRTGESMVVPLV